MKLILCRKGLIGTKVRRQDIYIDKMPDEERGYTLVNDTTAEELLRQEGYESISRESYPRDFDKLFIICRRNRQVRETTSANTRIETRNVKPCLWCRFRHWLVNKS